MIRRSAALAAVLASSALLLGACGPTTEIYQVTSAQYAGMSEGLAHVEVDLEECKPAPGSGATAQKLGFVEIGRGCQMPIHWLTPPEPGVSLRRFALVGGPYRCNVGVTPGSIRDVHGVVVGDDLSLTIELGDTSVSDAGVDPSAYLGIPHQVELRGERDGSGDSAMICGLPSEPFKVSQR